MADAVASKASVLALRDAGFGYRADRWLFRHLTMTLAPGEAGVVLGPNGAGKTSLMRCILGQAALSSGRLDRPERIGHVPQSLALLFDFSARDIVAMGLARDIGLFSGPGPAEWRKAEAALDRVGMADFARRGFASLSGGEKQLVLTARALVGDNSLLLLDEPTAALDLANQDRVMEVLHDLSADGETTILMSTHDPQHAFDLADRVLFMRGDGTSRFGAADDLLTEEALSGLYGVPIRRHEAEVAGASHAVFAPVAHQMRRNGAI